MPLPLIPPPANDTGAITFPRTLQKWLDCNPITALTRVSSFVTLPVFSINVNWQGYSDIVASFNFEGPSNFSFNSIATQIPTTPNFCLCVSWRDNNNNIFRYAVWSGVGEVFFFPVALYTGQMIAKNFRFEIWSVNNQAVASNATLMNFTTGALGGIDYRYGMDFQLVAADGINLNFAISPEAPAVTSPVTLCQQNTYGATPIFGDWLRADTGIVAANWSNRQTGGIENLFNGGIISGGSNITTSNADATLTGKTVVTGLLPIGSSSINDIFLGASPNFWALIKYNGDGILYQLKNATDITISIQNGFLWYTDTNGSVQVSQTQLSIGQWYILEIVLASVINAIPAGIIAHIWQFNQQANNQDYTNEVAVTTNAWRFSSLFNIGSNDAGSASIYIAELITYTSVLALADQLTNLQYFIFQYQNLFLFPWLFPVGSYSQPNIIATVPLYRNQLNISQGGLVTITSGGGAIGAG